ncbi:MAG: hypothetical protein K2I01_07975 [Lachnospiraceae bacterium]|nr:hypothetical protein [Lachnospiraceae bacterium]
MIYNVREGQSRRLDKQPQQPSLLALLRLFIQSLSERSEPDKLCCRQQGLSGSARCKQ